MKNEAASPQDRRVEALRESEERFRTVVETIPHGIEEIDTSGVITFANLALHEQYECGDGELVGRSIFEFVATDSEREGLREYLKVLAKEQPQPTPYDGGKKTKSGKIIDVQVDWNYKRDDRGRVIGFISVITDITERKLALEENRRLALAVANASDGVMIAGMDGRISFVNRAAEKMHGREPGEMLRMKVFDIYADSSQETTAREIWEATVNYGSWTGEVVLQKKTGEEFPSMMSAALMTDEDGNPVGTVGISTDVTERTLLQDQLAQAQKMEAVGQLAGGVAHDFNNLLTAILGYAALAKRDREGGYLADDHLDQIESAGQRGTAITQQLLTFTSRQPHNPAVIVLNDCVLSICSMLRRLLGENIELIAMPSPGLDLVRVDTGQIEQVLVNMAVNARDAMPDGGKLTIEMANVTLGPESRQRVDLALGQYVRLSVSDTGLGMSQEVQARMFEPFFTTKDVGKGTGLGLATCYGIVKQSGGEIRVTSKPGKGSTFEVFLPSLREDALGPSVPHNQGDFEGGLDPQRDL